MRPKNLKILLVEDDEDDVFLVKEWLRQGFPDADYIIDCSSSGKKALSLMESTPYDVALFDYSLGEMDGISLLRLVRQKGYKLPIIILTGRGDQKIAVDAMKAGATDYIDKSNLNVDVFSTAVRDALEGYEESSPPSEFAPNQETKAISSLVGDDFLNSLVQYLARKIPARNAYISALVPNGNSKWRILAGWEGEDLIRDPSYNVTETSCDEVLAGMMTYHPDNIQGLFPGDEFLINAKARSYAGIPCYDSSCKLIGHISVMDDKPMMDKERILSVLKSFAQRAGAELERKRMERKIRDMAYHDALTGLPNRLLLNDRLEMGLANAQRSHTMLAVLFMDFDRFKVINDTLGHEVGDQLLQKISERLKKCLRDADTVARMGGDEFVLLLPEIHSPNDAERLIQKLIEVIRMPLRLEGHELTITMSIGVALYPKDGREVKTLLKQADDALYIAKAEGRDCYHFCNSP